MITLKCISLGEPVYPVEDDEDILAVVASNGRYQAMTFKKGCRIEEVAVDLIMLGQSILDDENLKEDK